MKYTKMMNAITIVAALLAFGCGPNGDNNTNSSTNNSTTGPGETDVIQELGTILISDDEALLRTAVNADGTQVAVATRNLRTSTDRVVIYTTADGTEVRAMKELGDAGAPFTGDVVEVKGLFWSADDQITANLSFNNRYTWDATTGDVLLSKVDGTLVDKCAGPNRFEAFHPTYNRAFVATQGLPADNTLCRIDIDSDTNEAFTLAGGAVIEWAALDSTGEVLWVSFSNPTDDNLFSKEIVATIAFDAGTMMPTGDTVTTRDVTIAVGEGYFITRDPFALTATRGELIATGDEEALVAPNANVLVADISGGDEIAVIAIPEGTVIGILPDDYAVARSLSADGSVAAIGDRDDGVVLYDVSQRTGVSAYAPEPVPPAGTLTGTITIDGTEETLTGSCEVIIDDTIGPVGFTAFATTSGGWDLRAHSQNALLYKAYEMKKDDTVYINSNEIAQSLEIPFPTAESDGTTIQGSASLITFKPNEIFEPFEDADHPTGFKAIDIVIDASCAQ